MKHTIIFAAVCCLTLFAQRAPILAAPANPRPVVVELFESEGCSDCPAAETLLASLIISQPVAGVQIIPIEEHVTYFDNPVHWVDQFSSSQVTERQYDYSAAFKDNSVYTPEMVVDGSAHFVGSDQSAALSAISDAAKIAAANVRLSLSGGAGDQITASISIRDVPAMIAAKKIAVILAITEDDVSSNVTGGENKGRVLSHIAVTKSLDFVGYLMQSSNDFQTTLEIPKTRTRHPLHVIAFLQDTQSKRIYGANQQPL
jgi:hypothetical protein